jgi:hypothetical protein
MTVNIYRVIIAAAIAVGLFGCGGGGGTNITPEKTFALQGMFESYLSTQHNYTETTSGSLSDLTITASGVRSMSAVVTTTFENTPALVVTEMRTGTTTISGQSENYSSEIKIIYNLSKQRIGRTQKDAPSTTLSNYGVIQNVPVGFPMSAKVGDAGNLWTMNIYADATKKTLSGVQVATWALKTGVGSAVALLEISETITVPNNPSLAITLTQYAIDSSNSLVMIKEQIDLKNGTTVAGSFNSNFTGK